MTKPQEPEGRKITPLQTSLVGAGVLAAGALLTGGAHYASTAKKLADEGIAPAARLKAFPLAAQALAVSTIVCAALGGAALLGWQLLGLESRDVTDVATFSDAVALAKQQRDIVRRELRANLLQEEANENDSKGAQEAQNQ